LVTTSPRTAPAGVEVVAVDTAAEMHDAVLERADADVVVMAAAVADFRPVTVEDQKLKKAAGIPEIRLEPTVDILAALGAAKRPGQTLVGFAAETTDVEANARGKLAAKGADLLVANDVSAPEVGFEHDTNAVVIHSATGPDVEVPLSGKAAVADAVVDSIVAHRLRSTGSPQPRS
jgi:phosphopantothenoylcysteine decarboxylase/phosphopantothenate--cysteine ligase